MVCFYSDNREEIEGIDKVMGRQQEKRVLLFRDFTKQLDCEKLFNLRQIYSIPEIAIEYSQSMEEKVSTLIVESYGKLSRFWHKLVN